jgi:hypothetical protein
MSALHRSVAITLIVTTFVSSASAANAQSAPAPPPVAAPVQSAPSGDTLAAGLLDGETLGEGQRTGGNLGAGLAVGVLTGLIGTGIGYFVVGPSPLSAEALQKSAGRSADYQLGLKTGWERKTKSKKRNAFLAGGLLGTVAWIAIYSAAQSAE